MQSVQNADSWDGRPEFLANRGSYCTKRLFHMAGLDSVLV